MTATLEGTQAFAEAWTQLVVRAAMSGRVSRSMPQRCFRPELLLLLAHAPSEGLCGTDAALALRGNQGAMSRALKTWDQLGVVTYQLEHGSPQELGRKQRKFYRLTRLGRELAERLEAEHER